MANRQLRTWVFMLYPDNENHQKAIQILDKMNNSIYIKHIAKFNDDGSIKNKEHYHCILRYEQGYYLSALIKDLNLNYDEDNHLFLSYRDFKRNNKPIYKTIDDYISYLDHINTNKIDKYDLNDFKGGDRDYAISVINRRENNNIESFIDLCEILKDYHNEHVFEYLTFLDYFKVATENGYGSLFYNNWYKLRDIIKPWLRY